MLSNVYWDIDRNGKLDAAELCLGQWVAKESAKAHRDHTSRRQLVATQDLQGFLGEWRFFKYLAYQGIPFNWGGWLNKAAGDEFDFMINGRRIDVKTRATNREYGIGDYEVILDDPSEGRGNQINKAMDVYVFTLLVKADRNILLLGWSDKERFKQARSYRVVEKGDELWPGHVANERVHLIKVEDLEPIARLGSHLGL